MFLLQLVWPSAEGLKATFLSVFVPARVQCGLVLWRTRLHLHPDEWHHDCCQRSLRETKVRCKGTWQRHRMNGGHCWEGGAINCRDRNLSSGTCVWTFDSRDMFNKQSCVICCWSWDESVCRSRNVLQLVISLGSGVTRRSGELPRSSRSPALECDVWAELPELT